MRHPVCTVERLKEPYECLRMEEQFRAAVGEEPLEPEALERLTEAVRQDKIIFFAARMGAQIVGICSVSPCFSTFACKPCGVFDDFYVQPDCRKTGTARLLVQAAQEWCREHGCASLIVGCSDEDSAMYQSLGFDIRLGTMRACNL